MMQSECVVANHELIKSLMEKAPVMAFFKTWWTVLGWTPHILTQNIWDIDDSMLMNVV